MTAPPIDVDRLLDEMPMLRALIAEHREARPLEGLELLLLQHQMQDVCVQLRGFFEWGVRPEDVWWLDIPYTSHAAVRETAAHLGVPRENLWVHSFGSHEVYKGHQVRRVGRWLAERASAGRGKRLLVLDDGAYYLRALDAAVEPGSVAVVEQTQRGLNMVREHPQGEAILASLPVVNVAESRPKKGVEPRFIAEAVAGALEEAMGEYGAEGARAPWLVLGWGAIGAAVTAVLREALGKPAAEVAVWDVDSNRLELALAQGYQRWLRHEDTRRYGLVLGCTGRPSFPLGELDCLADGALLASASSSGVEFSRDGTLARAKRGAGVELRNPAELDGLHAPLRLAAFGKELVLLNGGFPLNFDGQRYDRIPPAKVQMTAGLMMVGALQAAASRGVGIEPLAARHEEWLEAHFAPA